MKISPLAGKVISQSQLVNIPKLVTAYYTEKPDPGCDEQKVSFGTSGHRGSSLDKSFNESHILAITQAICFFRQLHKIKGPLFLGIDTHALSEPALATAVEVLAGNGQTIMLAESNAYTPTPAVSLAILNYNRGKQSALADGIVITPSHNPPHQGGFKYNSTKGGPSELSETKWIEAKANEILQNDLKEVKRMPYEKALGASTTLRFDFMKAYVEDLANVLDLKVISDSKIHIGADPLGGAGVAYWNRIAEHYKLNLTTINETVDPTFRFMPADWDGQIRMDPSSPYAMQGVIDLKNSYDITIACDTDHDRHGIVTRNQGLLPPNHYLSAAIYYLFQHRPSWKKEAAIGKTAVSSKMIDRIAGKIGRNIYEVPVGFKWFVEGLFDGSLAFVGEESAGGAFVRFDGTVWTTDKDGIQLALLAAEITAIMGKDPGEIYEDLTKEFGKSYFERIEAKASLEERKKLKTLTPDKVRHTHLADEAIETVSSTATGNHASLDGIKIETKNGWFAARPSGTENITKIYAESFISEEHLKKILNEAQHIVDRALH